MQAEAPIVEDIEATTDEDVSISVTLTATDPQDLDLTISLGNTQPENGSVTLEGNILTYTPDANWNGTDTVSYKASNAYLDSNEGVISIVVNPVDDEPNTLDIDATTDEDTAISLVLAAEEVDGESYTFSIITAPSNGQPHLVVVIQYHILQMQIGMVLIHLRSKQQIIEIQVELILLQLL